MNPRVLLASCVVVLQLGVLGFMAGQREWIAQFGHPLLLRTTPIDPNDPMRGEFALLDYEISHVPSPWLHGGTKPNPYGYNQLRDLKVYAQLKENEAGIAEIVALGVRPPDRGLYLAGRVQYEDGNRITVHYGIEALFLEQGKARQLEEARRKERPGVPLLIEVAVDSSGVAVLRGYRWAPLGLTATFERATVPATKGNERTGARPMPARQYVSAINLEVKNYGPDQVAIVDLASPGAWRLVPNNSTQSSQYRWVGEAGSSARPSAQDVILLKSGQVHKCHIDLSDRQWFVVDTNLPLAQQTPVPLRDLTNTWGASFRIEYKPPTKADTAGLPGADAIFHDRLLSRAFSPTMGMD